VGVGRRAAAGFAEAAQLRYVSDTYPGMRRLAAGRGFCYVRADGAPVRDIATLQRIRSLAVPPAWKSVWICPVAHGHLQAVGRDARGRKQYRYHPRWRAIRDETKYARLAEFGRALPRIRSRVFSDLALCGLTRHKVLATLVRLLEATAIRVGNEEYVRENHSYGLSTLRNRHVTVEGSKLCFEFRGKGGRRHCVHMSDRRIAGIVRRCQDLPGQELFQYLDQSGRRQAIDSADVNGYLREIGGGDFTAKDFRTWVGTVLAVRALMDGPVVPDTRTARQQHLREAIRHVSARLGNTPTICRKSYVHPCVIQAYLEKRLARRPGRMRTVRGLDPEEIVVLSLLEKRSQRSVA
jgi:DNA topoisomerase I